MNFLNKLKNVFKKEPWKLEIFAPVDGDLVAVKDIPDETFSSGMLGEGLAIKPKSETVASPFTGQLEVAFETGHAYVLKDKETGVSLLLHLGVDTVNIAKEKKAFTRNVEQGQDVTVGSTLGTMDLKVVRANAPSDLAILLVQSDNMEKRKVTYQKTTGPVKKGDLLMTVVLAQ